MMITELVKKYLILLRPYTLANIIVLSLIPFFLLPQITQTNPIRDVSVGILFWAAIILGKEVVHKDTDNRGVPKWIPISIGMILIILLETQQPISLIYLPISLITFALYSFKIKDWVFAPISFLFRGFLEVLILMTIFTLYIPINQIFENYLPLLIAIFFLTNSRNLIGDLRDAHKDKYTFPAKFGLPLSKIISIIFALIICIIYPWPVTIPIVAIILLILTSNNWSKIHQIYVIATGFFLIQFIAWTLNYNLLLTNLCFLIVIFNFSYDLIKR
jgi:hypothetical protein